MHGLSGTDVFHLNTSSINQPDNKRRNPKKSRIDDFTALTTHIRLLSARTSRCLASVLVFDNSIKHFFRVVPCSGELSASFASRLGGARLCSSENIIDHH